MSSRATIIEEAEEGFDLQLLSIYLMGVAAFIGALYWAKNKYLPASKPAPVKTEPEVAKGPKEVDMDWLPAHHLNQRSNSSKARQRKT
ncbi:hypothetical protein BDF22DRAFT_740387 [Syncephalis plumigaleata]|nr:hypothetical protein BDF22DRAFT_740387 [Syncephalis plumigaleata]